MGVAEDLTAIAADARKLADRVERMVEQLRGDATPVFDPEDEPPVRTNAQGDRTQRDWGAVLLWGRLLALNVRANRGAGRDDLVRIAVEAGYQDGRGWGNWSGRDEREDGRWINKDGVGHLRHYYGEVGRNLPADLAKAAERLSSADA